MLDLRSFRFARVIKTYARSRAVHTLRMFTAIDVAAPVYKSTLTVLAGLDSKSSVKRPAKRFVALKATSERDFQDRVVTSEEHDRGAIQTQPLDKPLGRLACDGREHPMKVKNGQARLPR